MADRLSTLRLVDPVLTNLARGYSNNEAVADALFPIVSGLTKEAGKYPQFGKEAFKLYNTERAIRAASNRISPEGVTLLDYVMTEYDIEYPVDYREEEDSAFPLQAHATNTVTGSIAVSREFKAAALATNPANYAATNKIALAADACWSEPGSDPAGDVATGREAIRKRTGKRPNVLVIGPTTLNVLENHPQMLARVPSDQSKVVTMDIIKAVLKIQNIVVGEMVYSDDADEFHDIWGDVAVLAYVPAATTGQERTKYEPSYGYTFRKGAGAEVDRYPENGGKLEMVRNTDRFDLKIAGADAGYLITNTVK